MNSITSRLKHEQFPIIEGDKVTFVWRGQTAPSLQGDFTDWERGAPVRLQKAGRNLWVYNTTFPTDAYIEYVFLDGEKRILDPLNPHHIPNGFGGTNNYFYMPAASPTTLMKRRRGAPCGIVTRHKVETGHLAAGKFRDVYLYQPTSESPGPLLVVWDGRDFLHRGSLVQVVDNLINQGRMQPVAMALVDNGGSARVPEYACSDSTLAFLYYQVLPLARVHLNLLDVDRLPGAFGVMGASMGGLMALYTALRLPQLFGKVLCQSGGFWMDEVESIVFDIVGKNDVQPLKLWMDVGLYDIWVLLKSNRVLHELLLSRGYDVAYREYPAGHNYSAWRNEVWRGLEYLFEK